VPHADNLHPGRNRAGIILIGLAGGILVASSITKLAGVPAVVNQLLGFGFGGGQVVLVGVLEAISGVLFLLPRTRSFGLVLVSGFLGGAIATHLQHGEMPFPPVAVIAVAWIGVALRHPVVFWSFTSSVTLSESMTTSRHTRSIA
jgi:hypothetical protein